MKLSPFKLERYFVPYEFSAKYLLCSSDCDGLSQEWLVSGTDEECRKLWQELKLGYTQSQGHPLLRDEIAKLYKNVPKEKILVVTPEEGIFIALNTILSPGDHIICTTPGYQSLYEVALGLGCEVTKWELKEKDTWTLDLEFLEKNIKSNTKLLIVNFPHNPTGFLPSQKEFKAIVEVAKRHNLFIFSDEMYRFLEYNQNDRLPSACEVYDRAIALFGMSKTFGMAGVRIGWLATQNQGLLQKMAIFKDYTTICSSAPSELLSLMALRNKQKIIDKHLLRISRNLGLLDHFFLKYQSLFTWVKPKAGTIAFPRLNDGSSLAFCSKLVKDTGIMLLPSTVYGHDDNHFRLGFGRENMPEALASLENYLNTTRN